MNIITKRSRLGLAAIVAVALTGCGGSGSDSAEEGMGVLNLNVSDAGVDAAKVCIKFDGVHVKPTGEDPPLEIVLDAPVTVNLLANQGANSQPITSEQIPAGTYQWIRLMVDASTGSNGGVDDGGLDTDACEVDGDGSYLLDLDGNTYNLFIPSGNQSGLKLIKDITIPVNASGNYTAEWDLGKSFIAPPGLAPDAIMKPVVKLVANNEVGTLVGQVADDLVNPAPVEPPACDSEFAPKVYVFDEGVEPNPINDPDDPDEFDPVATGLVTQQQQDDGSMQYRYSIGFLLAGPYDPVFTCDGETFVRPFPTDQEGLIDDETTTIEIGETTTVNFEIDNSGS